jgi:hypothetical protein
MDGWATLAISSSEALQCQIAWQSFIFGKSVCFKMTGRDVVADFPILPSKCKSLDQPASARKKPFPQTERPYRRRKDLSGVRKGAFSYETSFEPINERLDVTVPQFALNQSRHLQRRHQGSSDPPKGSQAIGCGHVLTLCAI